MPEKPTLEVVVEKIRGIETLINYRFDENQKQHEEIIVHQKKTNGKVLKNTEWRYYIMGAIAILSTIVLPVFFIAVKQLLVGG